MPALSEKKLKVFYCYARRDQELREALECHLSHLKRLYHLETWFDREIRPGQIWKKAIDEQLKRADLILLLISPDFLASDYCYRKEMLYALTRHASGEAKVLPILLRPVHWKDAPFSHIQALPKDALPVTRWPDRDEAFSDIARGIDLVLQELLSRPETATSPTESASQEDDPPVVPELPPPVKPDLSRRAIVARLAGVAAVGAVGGGFFWLTHPQPPQSSTSASHPDPSTQTEIAQAKNDLEAYTTANGIMFGFDANHTRYNPFESILSIRNVALLKPAWQVFTKGRVSESPVVAHGVVYIGSEDSSLYAFDATTGTKLWTAQTGGRVSSPAVDANKIVYVGSEDGNLYAFDTTQGSASRRPVWIAKTGTTITSPTIVNGIVYVGALDHNVYAFDSQAGGSPLWTAHTGDAIFGSPAVFQGVVYVGSRDSNVYALDARTGQQLWKFKTGAGIDASPAVDHGTVYIGSRDRYLYALDARTGVLKWRADTEFTLLSSSAAVANEEVYIGSRSGYLYSIEATSGYVNWTAMTTSNGDGINGIESSPTVANGVVYVASDDGYVYAFDTNRGPKDLPLWKQHVRAFYTCPTVANGMLYIGGEFDNALDAFHLP